MVRNLSTVNRHKDSKVKVRGKTLLCTQKNKMKILEPSTEDVLFGRGGAINRHKGNEQFRSIISVMQKSYNLDSNKKDDKTKISRNVVTLIKNSGGRFLTRENISKSKKVTWSKWWVEVDDNKAMSKTSQALREGAPSRALEKRSLPIKRKSAGAEVTKLPSAKCLKKSRKVILHDKTDLVERCISSDSLYRMELGSLELSGFNDIFDGAEIFTKEIFANPVQISVNVADSERALTPNLEVESKPFEYAFTEKEREKLVMPYLENSPFDKKEGIFSKSDFTPYPVMESDYPFTDKENKTFLLILRDLQNMH